MRQRHGHPLPCRDPWPSSAIVLAIDQGTTGTHVSSLDAKLQVVGKAYREFTQHFPKPGWVEHDLDEIWALGRAVHRARRCKDAGLKGKDIAAIGITNQRETTGPVGPRHAASRCTAPSSGRTGAPRSSAPS